MTRFIILSLKCGISAALLLSTNVFAGNEVAQSSDSAGTSLNAGDYVWISNKTICKQLTPKGVLATVPLEEVKAGKTLPGCHKLKNWTEAENAYKHLEETVKSGVPPHQKGMICYTPYFWCWAQPPGPNGTTCACPSPRGIVPGVRG